jgi:anaerobic selenocysteine-containing dehydrogenase
MDDSSRSKTLRRRTFLKTMGATGAAMAAAPLLNLAATKEAVTPKTRPRNLILIVTDQERSIHSGPGRTCRDTTC